ncbi:MAG: metallophosphoesterase [Alphaproteobacteria bacterium]|nr:metallophosphoesterase [Alphaproteobacteria bacterium]
MHLSKRALLGGGVALLGTAVAGKTLADTFGPVAVRHYHLATPKWPASAAPLKIVFISDTHIGSPSVPLTRVKEIVDLANAQLPDITLLGGDYLISDVIGGSYVPPEAIAPEIARLRAPYGVYSVLGNHEWYKDGEGMWRELEQNGVTVLENAGREIATSDGGSFWLAGLADDTTRQPDYTHAMANAPADKPVIALMHDPAALTYCDTRPALALAGHTHGGQITAPLHGAFFNASRAPLEYSYGHVKWDEKDLIVTSGIGTSVMPFRFFTEPEIVVIHLSHS